VVSLPKVISKESVNAHNVNPLNTIVDASGESLTNDRGLTTMILELNLAVATPSVELLRQAVFGLGTGQ